jgi:MFS family permease
MNKNILLLGFVSFFTDFASALINPVLPIFILSYLHEGVDKVGIVIAVATLVSYAFRILSGYISDRYGITKPLLWIGYGLSAFCKPLIGFTHDYKSVALLRGLERLGKALRSAPKDAMIAHFGGKRSGRAFGLHKTLDIAGEFGGTLTLIAVFFFFGQSETVLRNIFFFTIVPGILALVTLLFVADVPKQKSSLSLRLQDTRAAKELLFYLLFALFAFNDALYVLAAKEAGASLLAISALYLLFTATQTATSYYFGTLIDRFGAETMGGVAFFLAVAALLLLPYSLAAAFGVFGLHQVLYLNAIRSFIANRPKQKATLYGYFYAGYALFGSLGALLLTYVWHTYGFEWALRISLFGMIGVILLYTRKFYGQKRV